MTKLLVSKNLNMDMIFISNESVNGTKTMKNELKTNFGKKKEKKEKSSALGFQSLESFETNN